MSAETKSSLAERLSTLSPRARQYLVLGSLGTVFLGLVFGSVALWDNQPALTPQNGKEALQSRNIATPGAQAEPHLLQVTKTQLLNLKSLEFLQGWHFR